MFLWTGVAVALVMLSSCVGCVIVGSRAQGEGEAFVRAFAPRAMQPWSAAPFSEVAGSQLFRDTTPEQFKKFIGFVAARLGSLKTVTSVRNGPFSVYGVTQGFQVRTPYVMRAEFEKGPAIVNWLLLRQNGTWRV